MTPAGEPDLRLYLVRHGETAWSLTGQHTGRTDLPLTRHGEDQGLRLAPCLKNLEFSLVLASPLARARRTCELAGLGESATLDPDLREWDYGEYEGRRSEDICLRRPGWRIWRDGCPGGESPARVFRRADRLIERLLQRSGNVALFSHGQFGGVLGARWLGLPGVGGRHFTLGPGSLSILGSDPGHRDTRVIALWNAEAGTLPAASPGAG